MRTLLLPALLVHGFLPALVLATPAPEARPWSPVPGEAFALHDLAVSPDGSTLCVGYLGDLWLVPRDGGTARRLTDHVGYDASPAWSRDGRWIAFSSRREGNMDVFLVAAEGGPAEQLTFHAVDEWVTGFTPDGREVLFGSSRDGRFRELWAVSVEGGTPRRVTRDRVVDGRLSPDGSTLAYTRGGGGFWRQGYRGSNNAEIWLAAMGSGREPVASGVPVRITRNDVHDRAPFWTPDGKTLIYLSERSGVANLWRQTVGQGGAGTAEPLTRYTDVGIEYPSLSADGSTAAFVCGGFLWVMDLGAGGGPERVAVEARSDDKVSQRERLKVTDSATDLVLSPDGKRVAFVLHGDLFTHPTEPNDEGEEETSRHTESPVRDQTPAFGPGADELIFVSDQDGKQDLWIADLTREGDLTPRRVTDTPEEEFEPQVSPDGKWILYTAGHEDLMVRPASATKSGSRSRGKSVGKSAGNARLLVKGPQNYTPHWSPDSRWVAYERHDASEMGDIWVVEVADVKGAPVSAPPINLTKDPAHDQMPFWSPDGMTLGYESDRDGDWDLWSLSLVDDDVRKARKQAREHDKDSEKEGKEKSKGKAGEGNGKKVEPIKIDRDRDYEPRHLVDLGGEQGEAVFSPDSEQLLFLSNTLGDWDIWIADGEGKNPKQLTDDDARESAMAWLPDGKKFVYLSEGRIKTLTPGGDSGALEFAVRMVVDHSAERLTAFDEAWRLIRHDFYDEKLHGVDWTAVRARYRPCVEHAATRDELHMAILRMLGELRASHLGVSGPDEPGAVETAYLGLEFEAVEEKGDLRLKVSDVLPRGPADQEEARVEKGETLVSIDGKSVHGRMSIDPFLDGKVDKKVRLTLAGKSGKTHDVMVKGVNRQKFLDKVYERWVDERKEMVKKLSNGRVGYIHVRQMDQESLRKFRQAIIADVYDREGLVLDVRDNGGGNIHEALLEVLEGKRYIVSQPRGGERRLAPALGWYRPIVLLINENSGSDAEIFPHGFKTLQLGKLIGVPTFGGVIGTGQTTLIEGSTLRLPRVGWYSLDGKNLENWGIEPDILVEQDPADRARGADTQLVRAVTEVMAEIGDGKPKETAGATVGAESR